MTDREKIAIPEPLRSQVESRFGDGTTSDAEWLRRALWYAVERYDAEHPDGPPASITTDGETK